MVKAVTRLKRPAISAIPRKHRLEESQVVAFSLLDGAFFVEEVFMFGNSHLGAWHLPSGCQGPRCEKFGDRRKNARGLITSRVLD